MNVHTSKAVNACGIPLQKAHDVCHVQLETPRPALVRHTHCWNAGHALSRGGKGRQRFLRQNGRWGLNSQLQKEWDSHPVVHVTSHCDGDRRS